MLFALLGVLFGVVGGMGMGGGIVLIPALTLLMGITQHTAQGMTLFAYIPMAVFALISHIRQKSVHIKPLLFITAFGLAGGAGGYFLASCIDEHALSTVFAIFLIAAACLRAWRQEVSPWLKKRRETGKDHKGR